MSLLLILYLWKFLKSSFHVLQYPSISSIYPSNVNSLDWKSPRLVSICMNLWKSTSLILYLLYVLLPISLQFHGWGFPIIASPTLKISSSLMFVWKFISLNTYYFKIIKSSCVSLPYPGKSTSRSQISLKINQPCFVTFKNLLVFKISKKLLASSKKNLAFSEKTFWPSWYENLAFYEICWYSLRKATNLLWYD